MIKKDLLLKKKYYICIITCVKLSIFLQGVINYNRYIHLTFRPQFV